MAFWNVSVHDSITVLAFDRPPRNLMSMAAMSELEALVEEIRDDDTVNVVVLTGAVDGYFVAHADLEDLAAMGRGEPVEGDPGSWPRTFSILEAMPQPVVAAVNGQAWGGGCELSLACTLRVAAASAHFGQPEVVVGIIPGAGGTQRLPRLIGAGRATELILSGRIIDAAEAERLGLVEKVLPDDGFLDSVLEWVEPIATKPRHAVTAAKQAIIEGLRLPLEDGLALEGRLFVECQTRPDTIELQVEVGRLNDPVP